jgi:hypothetical protein
MDLYIDTEFNGFGGELISMAIVDENFNYFYEIVGGNWVFNPDPWVQKNVIPYLQSGGFRKDILSEKDFKAKLDNFLSKYHRFNLVADWPDDIKYFCDAVVTGPGQVMDITSFSVEVLRELNGDSKIPHNAFWDAIGNVEMALNKKYEDRYEEL